jgi:hypothetical protein
MTPADRAKIAAMAITIASGVAASLLAGRAGAHEAPTGWTYPALCCSNKDCKQISATEVRAVKTGWLVEKTGEVISYGDTRLKDSPDGLYHRCAHAANFESGKTLCLFVPPMGF